jgi:prepilin-type N-terminal cleavage/methylation domain-containing protein
MKTTKQGFTLVEIMIVVAIIGLLAAIGVPSIMKAYQTSQEKAMAANIKRVQDAKTTLTLPADSVIGAAGVTVTTGAISADDLVEMFEGLQIPNEDALDVGNYQMVIGDWETKATYTLSE